MTDRVDKILDDKLPLLREAVKAGLAKRPVLSSLVPVIRDETPMPYRRLAPFERIPFYGRPALSRLRANIDWAYEIALAEQTTARDLFEQSDDHLRWRFRSFAEKAHECERAAVCHLLKSKQLHAGRLDEETLNRAVERLGGACRFLGKSPIADDAKDSGVLDDVQQHTPDGTGGMVILLERGPLVRRLVEDDLTLTWTRVSGTEVRFELSEQFFLDHPERGRWFSPPGTVAKKTLH
ncbi:hypothetical protein [Geodermatophilus dictyosporus]|uniref:hypothetical protein n=1 Tax=Geodermatophilus dictyosporus TaxID=1523247 RepID=UPI000B88E0E3|nr:hypothetical protein [Geodermatophilus dictyosporus]